MPRLTLTFRSATLAACLLASWPLRPACADTLYEHARLERAIAEHGYEHASQPEDVPIAFVTVARDDVFVDDELWPTWPNIFRWLTAEDVIRRELLLGVGDLYDEAKVQESMRNLRGLGIFALVHIAAVRDPVTGAMGLLVYTRDLWSLRPETGFAGTGGALQLNAQLTERNFLGRNKQLAARLALNPLSYSLGQVYNDWRMGGQQLSLTESFDVHFNRATGRAEGTQGSLAFGRPFYNLAQKFSWSVAGRYRIFVNRTLSDTDVAGFDAQGQQCLPGAEGCYRSVWDDRDVAVAAIARYRYGHRYKQAFSAGVGYTDRSVAPNEETALAPGEEEIFRSLLPMTQREIYPLFRYDLFLPDFVVFQNLGTFGQSENVRRGPQLHANVSFPLQLWGSTYDSMRVGGLIGYVFAGGDALLDLSLSGSARLLEERVVDQRLTATVRGATPRWFFGRLIWRGTIDARRNDTLRTRVMLGGDTGLRGYKAGALQVIGGSRMIGNLEYRTQPVVIETVHVGGVAFYDAGTRYTSLRDARFKHAAGAGLRVLFPQFNRYVFRVDVGTPLGDGGFALMLSYGSEQAILLTGEEELASQAARPREEQLASQVLQGP